MAACLSSEEALIGSTQRGPSETALFYVDRMKSTANVVTSFPSRRDIEDVRFEPATAA